MMQAVGYYLTLPFLYLFSKLPFTVLYFISDLVYFLIYYVFGYRKKVVRLNLKRSFPEKNTQDLTDIEKKFYRYITDMTLETIKCITISQEELKKRVVLKDDRILQELYAKGRNVIITMGHYGNHELVNLALPHTIPHIPKAVYRPLSNKYFDNFFKNWRERFGGKMIAMADAQIEIRKTEERPFAFFLVNDQSAPPERAYRTTFLNQETFYFTGPERFAKGFDLPVVFLRTEMPKRGYYELYFELISETPKDLAPNEILEIHSKKLERDIIDRPELWFWSHKRWKYKLVDGEYQGVNYH